MSEKSIFFSVTSDGRGHIFNWVSCVICVCLVELYENYVNASLPLSC